MCYLVKLIYILIEVSFIYILTELYLCSLVDHVGQHCLHHAWTLRDLWIHLEYEVKVLLRVLC